MKVFFDPEKRRWKMVTRIFAVLIGIFTVVTYFFVVSVLINPALPELGLKSLSLLSRKGIVNDLEIEKKEKVTDAFKRKLAQIQKESAAQKKVAPQQNSRKTFAFYVEWDDNSFSSLSRNISQIDYLLPVWLSLDKNSLNLQVIDQVKMNRTLEFLKTSAYRPKILPVINNYDDQSNTWMVDPVMKILDDKAKSAKLIADLKNFVQSNGFAGISLDLEDIPLDHYKKFEEFSRELWTDFKKDNLIVSTSLAFDDKDLNYGELSKWNDYLILMAYDEHWSTSDSGPVTSQKWFEQTLLYDQKLIPREKTVVALGNYGYDWQVGGKEATTVTFQDALRIAQESEGSIYFDDTSLSPTFDYYDDNSKLHHVYYLDAITAFNEKKFAEDFSPAGYALWRLGSEDPTYWQVMRDDFQKSIDGLKTVNNFYDISYEGTGDILKLKTEPQTGIRSVTYDSDIGLITDEDFSKYPLPYTISRYGNSGNKEIALTFDDGPDPGFTPKILDVLKANNVKATFFVIGTNAEQYTDVLKRIEDEGNLIGNHTFTHPNITLISDEQLNLELNATQRLFEGILGIRSLLFRPPYAEDIEPENLDQVLPLQKVSDKGYYTIGISIDPHDWQAPGTDKIVQAVLDQAIQNKGGVVLLHDSGGDRSQTVEALPLIIKKLRDNGFTIVPLNRLMGIDPSALNPKYNVSADMTSVSDSIYFNLIHGFDNLIGALFYISLCFGIFRMFLLLVFAVLEKIKALRAKFDEKYKPEVSIIMPAYNEGKVIREMLEAALSSDYEKLRIIVVDDGSTDDTLKILKDHFGHNHKVHILTKANEGKSKAINYGLEFAAGEIIVLIDADTVLDRKAVQYLVRHFSNPNVAAVAGNARVGNRVNVLTNFQALEYVTNQNLERRAFNLLNSITVVPGAIGAWRKDILVKMGGFNDHTLAEDNDMTIQMLKGGYTVGYEENAYAYTESPTTVSGLSKQRFRWTFGTLQVFWKNRSALFNPKYGSLAFVGLPNTFFFQILSPLILPIIDLSIIASLMLLLWKTYQHLDVNTAGQLQMFFVYYAVFTFLDFASVITAFILEPKRDWKLLFFLFPQRIFYRFFVNYMCLKSLLHALRGSVVRWNKIERKGKVKGH